VNWRLRVSSEQQKLNFLFATEINVRPQMVNEMGASDVEWIKMACDGAQGRDVVQTIVKHCPIKYGSLKEPINCLFPKNCS
jgi:hypothetical protein